MLPTEVTTAVIMWLPWLLKDQSEDSREVGKMRNSRYNGISKNYLWEPSNQKLFFLQELFACN